MLTENEKLEIKKCFSRARLTKQLQLITEIMALLYCAVDNTQRQLEDYVNLTRKEE